MKMKLIILLCLIFTLVGCNEESKKATETVTDNPNEGRDWRYTPIEAMTLEGIEGVWKKKNDEGRSYNGNHRMLQQFFLKIDATTMTDIEYRGRYFVEKANSFHFLDRQNQIIERLYGQVAFIGVEVDNPDSLHICNRYDDYCSFYVRAELPQHNAPPSHFEQDLKLDIKFVEKDFYGNVEDILELNVSNNEIKRVLAKPFRLTSFEDKRYRIYFSQLDEWDDIQPIQYELIIDAYFVGNDPNNINDYLLEISLKSIHGTSFYYQEQCWDKIDIGQDKTFVVEDNNELKQLIATFRLSADHSRLKLNAKKREGKWRRLQAPYSLPIPTNEFLQVDSEKFTRFQFAGHHHKQIQESFKDINLDSAIVITDERQLIWLGTDEKDRLNLCYAGKLCQYYTRLPDSEVIPERLIGTPDFGRKLQLKIDWLIDDELRLDFIVPSELVAHGLGRPFELEEINLTQYTIATRQSLCGGDNPYCFDYGLDVWFFFDGTDPTDLSHYYTLVRLKDNYGDMEESPETVKLVKFNVGDTMEINYQSEIDTSKASAKLRFEYAD